MDDSDSTHVCVGLQLIGDGLHDAFDPYSRAAGSVKQEEDFPRMTLSLVILRKHRF